MMKIRCSILLIFCIICSYAYAQNDAKSVLDKVAAVHNGYKTIQSGFKFSTTSPDNNEPRTETGKIFLKGDKYHLAMADMDVLFDGKGIYTYLPKSKEVNITKPEPAKKEKGDFFFSNPRDIFKGYNKNFKSTFYKENDTSNPAYYEIDLFPIDLKTKYTKVRMLIQKQSFHIVNITLFLKDGTKLFLEFTNFLPSEDIPDKEFIFDSKKYPGIEVNDMRF
jgi:outer membrane lipoprotein carrier protein